MFLGTLSEILTAYPSADVSSLEVEYTSYNDETIKDIFIFYPSTIQTLQFLCGEIFKKDHASFGGALIDMEIKIRVKSFFNRLPYKEGDKLAFPEYRDGKLGIAVNGLFYQEP